jgi:hypothetical protein
MAPPRYDGLSTSSIQVKGRRRFGKPNVGTASSPRVGSQIQKEIPKVWDP